MALEMRAVSLKLAFLTNIVCHIKCTQVVTNVNLTTYILTSLSQLVMIPDIIK